MTDTSPTTSQVQAELQPLPQRFSILETIKNVLPLLTQLTTFIILGGFVVVHSYLATITDLFGNTRAELHAPADGMIFGLRALPSVTTGDWCCFFNKVEGPRT